MNTFSTRISTRIRRGTVALVVAALALLATSVAPATAVVTPSSTRASVWLAAHVGPTGEVNISGSTQSPVTQTMYAAQGLAASGEQREALARAMAYLSLGAHVEEWVTNDGSGGTVAPAGSDLPERLASLILLARTTGLNPRAFGVPATDLVSRAQALYELTVPGFYGYPDPYSSVQDQSLMVIALQTVGSPPPTAAVDWIINQQCSGGSNPADTLGGWQSFRAVVGPVLADCESPDPINYYGVDTNSTAFAIQALALFGRTTEAASGIAFLLTAQASAGDFVGGFPWFTGGEVDANSTALVLQAIVSVGQSPIASAWTVGGSNPLLALQLFQLVAPGADEGAMFASWNPGVADLMATYQGIWGLTLTAFPFPVLPSITPDRAEPSVVPTFTG